MIEDQILEAVTDWKNTTSKTTIKPLFGDASSRVYMRLANKDFKAVAVKVTLTGSPEFGRGNAYSDFISVHKSFSSFVKLPEIYHVDENKGIIIQEDLGDTALFNLINKAETKTDLFKRALLLLIDWQNGALSKKRKKCVADEKKFDHKLFMDEFYHFYEYMIEKRVYYPSFEKLWDRLLPHFEKISSYLSSLPTTVAHRDFQSKNIMAKNDEFYLIDFQDALLSTPVYDLVALLRDSYIQLKEDELNTLLDFYWENSNVTSQNFSNKSDFLYAFHMQTVQRKLKDAGRFVFLNQIKKKKWFVPFIRPSLFYVRHSLEKLGRKDIIEELAPFISEFSEGDFK